MPAWLEQEPPNGTHLWGFFSFLKGAEAIFLENVSLQRRAQLSQFLSRVSSPWIQGLACCRPKKWASSLLQIPPETKDFPTYQNRPAKFCGNTYLNTLGKMKTFAMFSTLFLCKQRLLQELLGCGCQTQADYTVIFLRAYAVSKLAMLGTAPGQAGVFPWAKRTGAGNQWMKETTQLDQEAGLKDS